MHTPGITRPARPFLCNAFARDTQHISKLSIFWFELNLVSFILPLSITKTQSSIVMDVSAKFVLNTIFLVSLHFLKTKFCSSLDKDECKGMIINFPVFGVRYLLSFNRSFNVIISANPGKNT